jgi:hypothetical protein
MAIEDLMQIPVVIVSPVLGELDEYNTPDESALSRRQYDGWLTQTTATELRGDRQTEVIQDVLFLPGDAVVEATDRIEVDGKTYEIIAEPLRARRPQEPDEIHHIEVRLRRIEA